MPDFLTAIKDSTAAFLLVGCVLLLVIVILLMILLAKQKTLSERQFLLRDMISDTPTRDELLQRLDAQSARLTDSMDSRSRDEAQRIEAIYTRVDRLGDTQETRLHRVTATLDEKLSLNDRKIDQMRETLQQSVGKLQEENSKKLEEMRVTVDEKLHATLDKRLGESFSLVNERLEQVYKGLGEMQTLATGVGDLKKVLTNVKSRGVWGEMQLGTLLEQTLSRAQYDENVAVVPGSPQRVEFAVKMPGRDDGTVYLPIDAKFPIEDYERLLAAVEGGDPQAVAASTNALQSALLTEGKRIAGKYICPPHTTDFAVMFLPIEGLFAEALRMRGLAEELQEKHRIMVAGPTTLTALLTSLQVGFRTLAIEKRSGEVWRLLSAVKTEFGRFSELLAATQKKMIAVSDSIDKATKRTKAIERKLRDVEGLDTAQASLLLGEPDMADNEEETGDQAE